MIVIFLLLIASVGLGDEIVNLQKDFMVCRPLANVFGTVKRTVYNKTEELPVIQGATGPQGLKGEKGPTGPPGEPDYKKIAEILDDKLQFLNGRIYELERQVEDMKAPRQSKNKLAETTEENMHTDICLERFKAPFSFGKHCYKVIGNKGITYKKDAAEKACVAQGGHLADLNSRAMYKSMYNFIDHTYSVVIDAWLGMTFENDKLLLFNGTAAGYAKWSNGFPRQSSVSYYRTYSATHIFIDTSSNVMRLSNSIPTYTKNYAICQFSLIPEDATSTTRATTQATTTTRRSYYQGNDEYDDKK